MTFEIERLANSMPILGARGLWLTREDLSESHSVIRSAPPRYGRSALGIVTLPSAFWWFSRSGIRKRGLASTVLLSEWQTTVSVLPPSTALRYRMFKRRHWKS